MEARFSTDMLSRNLRSKNWKKSVHSTLHVGKDFYTTERPITGWKWAMTPWALVHSKARTKRTVPSRIRPQKPCVLPAQPHGQSESSEEDDIDVYDILHIDRPPPNPSSHDRSSTATKQPFGRGPNWRDLITEAFSTATTGFMR